MPSPERHYSNPSEAKEKSLKSQFTNHEFPADSPEKMIANLTVGENYIIYHRDYDPIAAKDRTPKFISLSAYIAEKLCGEDPYEKYHGGTTLGAYEDNIKHYDSFAGTIRMIQGRDTPHEGLLPFEGMGLLKPSQEWPHINQGLLHSEVVEMGRLAITPLYREYKKVKETIVTDITRTLIDGPNGVLDHARQRGLKAGYTILRKNAYKHISKTTLQLEYYKANLQKENPEANEIFQEFNRYWLDKNDPPRLFYFKIPEKK